MIHDQLREAYEKSVAGQLNGAEILVDYHQFSGTHYRDLKHTPPDVLFIAAMDIDQIPAFVDVELQPYYLDLTASTDETLVYRLGKR